MAKILFLQDVWIEYYGVMQLSALLKKNGHNTDILFASEENAVKEIKRIKPDLIAYSCMSIQWNWLKSMSTFLKKNGIQCPQAVGGIHSTMYPDLTIGHEAIDIICRGEGDYAMLDLCNSIDKKIDYSNIQNLWVKKENNIKKNEVRPKLTSNELTALPFPDRDLYSKYDYFKDYPFVTFVGSRGCPFKCVFCHDTLGKDFRHRSPDNIVNEIVWLKEKYDLEELEIVDDIFNFNIQHAKDVFRKLIDKKLGLKIAFPNGIKYEMIDTELLHLFKQGGVYRIAFGIESGDAQGQKLVRKKTNLQRMNEIIKEANEMGFFVSGFFQMGLPGETHEMIENTINFAVGSNLHTAMFHITTPFPGTPMFKEHVENTILSGQFNGSREDYEEKLRSRVNRRGNFRGEHGIPLNLSKVSDAELIGLKRKAFAKFYFNPKRIFSLYRATPVKKRLVKNFINVCSEVILRKWLVQA